jgi:ABC-type polysaccharide/polyol phosphate transport system ATPase subunit
MNDVVIKASGLGKKYLIGHRETDQRYVAIRDVIARSARELLRSAKSLLDGREIVGGDEIEEFWALKDVDFEIRRGEVVGIIGRNGAGKSTLLKILSRITEPSAGNVRLNGRIASLLEVGTGFHPELTGRENIYLNGAILGMSRSEIKKKFNEIVDFSGVEKFLDTPIKRYSSGMYVRLAFSVAAFIEPEILIVDEVLAVGDAAFQKKCLGKMQGVAASGRTVLLVSHDISAIQNLCNKGIYLSQGKIKESGIIENVISSYMRDNRQNDISQREMQLCDDVRLSCDVSDSRIPSGSEFTCEVKISLRQPVMMRFVRLIISTPMGVRVAVIDAAECIKSPLVLDKGQALLRFVVGSLNLVEGDYFLTLSVEFGTHQKNFNDIVVISVAPRKGSEIDSNVPAAWRGIVSLNSNIELKHTAY